MSLKRPRQALLDAIETELDDAMDRFPPFHSAHEGWAVLREEVDELWHEVCSKTDAPAHLLVERRFRMRHEAVQVAAMALRFIEECCWHVV